MVANGPRTAKTELIVTQAEIIRAMAKELGMTQDAAKNALGWIGHAVEATLRTGEHVSIPGLGKFTIQHMAERQGRNPKTGEALTIPARKKVKFKAAFEVE